MKMDIAYYDNLDSFLCECIEKDEKYLLLVSQNCIFDMNSIKESNIEVYGAVFPEVVYEDNSFKTGLVAYKLPSNAKVHLVKNIFDYKLFSKDFENMKSVICFIDGLSTNIIDFLESLFDLLDEDTQIIGGGAGKLPFNQEEVIFSNQGIFKDSALLITLENDIYVGVKHGWQILKSPLLATMSSQNNLHQIDYDDAFSVYRKIVEDDYKKSFDSEPFLDIVKSYPLGIIKFDNEVIVRDPIACEDNKKLVLVAGIPQNSIISVLKGDKKNLIKAANEATKIAVKDGNLDFEQAFIFDCISRRMFLGNDFVAEIDAVKQNIGDKKLIGALTLGEIANDGKVYINFFNKTCVVGALC